MVTGQPDHPEIEMHDVGIRYDGQWIMRHFSLRLARGEKVGLSGPSGVGKSTVLRCVLGLVEPAEGQVRVAGMPVDGQHVWEVRRKVAYVAQEPDLGQGTVRQILQRPFQYKANAHLRSNLDRAGQWLDHFNLSQSLLEKDMSTLSGGEKQRVALISAILLDRSIVLLDEASSALDKENKQKVAEFFRDAPRLTVLAVSHDAEWQNFADRNVTLSPPEAEEDGHD